MFSEERWRTLALEAGYCVRTLARLPAVGVSVRTLQRLFHQRFNSSPKLRLPRWRADVARALIQKGASNKDVIRALHYCDNSHLTRDFRQFFHATPQSVSPLKAGKTRPKPARKRPRARPSAKRGTRSGGPVRRSR